MTEEKTFWKPGLFKGKSVFLQSDEGGNLKVEGGLVPMRYQLGGKVYSASERNVTPEEGPIQVSDQGTPAPKKETTKGKKGNTPPPPRQGAVVAFTDGACSGNPGPAGYGVLIHDGNQGVEISGFLGDGTNNIAELEAIGAALGWLTTQDRAVDLYTDSSYAIGVLTKGWKAKANQDIIRRIRQQVAGQRNLQFHWVKGHAGLPGNEKADELARLAIERQDTETRSIPLLGDESTKELL